MFNVYFVEYLDIYYYFVSEIDFVI